MSQRSTSKVSYTVRHSTTGLDIAVHPRHPFHEDGMGRLISDLINPVRLVRTSAGPGAGEEYYIVLPA